MAAANLKATRDNAETIADLHHAANSRAGAHQRRIELVAGHLGTPAVLYSVIAVVAAWIGYNLSAARFGWPAPDPAPFGGLQTTMTLAGLLLTTVVVITQNRQVLIAERRAQLRK